MIVFYFILSYIINYVNQSRTSTMSMFLYLEDENSVTKESDKTTIRPRYCDQELAIHQHYINVVYGIIKQGEWTNAIVITGIGNIMCVSFHFNDILNIHINNPLFIHMYTSSVDS